MPGRIGAADDRADRGADHHIGHYAVGDQRPHNADMGKAARGAAAQRKPDHRPPNAAKSDLLAAVRSVLATPDQDIQHRKSPESIPESILSSQAEKILLTNSLRASS